MATQLNGKKSAASGTMDRSINRNCLLGFDGLLKRVLCFWPWCLLFSISSYIPFVVVVLKFELRASRVPRPVLNHWAIYITQLPLVTHIQTVTVRNCSTVATLTIYSLEDVRGIAAMSKSIDEEFVLSSSSALTDL